MCCGQRCDTYANFNFRIKEEEKWVIAAGWEIMKAQGSDDRFNCYNSSVLLLKKI